MVEKKLFDVGIFKAALEFARFSDPDVREALVGAINALDADLDEVSYDPSDLTMEAFENLIEVLDKDSEPNNETVESPDADGEDDSLEDFIQDSADDAEVEEIGFDDEDTEF